MDTITAKELAKQEFNGIKMHSPYGDLLDEIELSGIGFIWGESYSGKSTFALGLANAMADFGRIEYIPAEEHFGITLTKKVNNLKAYNNDLHFTKYKGLEGLKSHIKNVKPKSIFLDSISVLSANDQDVIDFAQWCREQGVGMWMVAHANKDGTYKGNSKLFHEADIAVEVMKEDKTATTRKNRYLGESRTIQVPFTAKDIKKKKGNAKKARENGKKKPETRNPEPENKDFNSAMDEVEQMMNAV